MRWAVPADYVLLRVRQIPRKIRPPAIVNSVSGSGVAILTFPKSAIENVSLPPCVLVRIAAKPRRLVKFAASCVAEKLEQPETEAFVHMNGLAASACAGSKTNAKPRLPWP